jgi:hypothetical protein
VGIIAGKESQSEGTTYAVSTKAVLQLLHTMPKANIHLPKTNKIGRLNREEQIEKLQGYTCLIQVYKK